MSYYRALGLTQEPFSTSPDPAFFFRSSAHLQALNRLEIAIRLKRGLCLIFGDVGIGKTTLARTLIANLQHDEHTVFDLVMDPGGYDSEYQFLHNLCRMFKVQPAFKSALDCREAIEHHLFQAGVTDGKTVVLVIDEGQKLSLEMLETLRVLLNYETNEYKLLQLVIFAQMELLPRIKRVKNFIDRAALKYIVNPLDEEEAARLIQFRLEAAGWRRDAPPLVSPEAVHAIYQHTQGYPRKIARLCHDALEALVMYERSVVDETTIRELVAHESRWLEEEHIA